MIETQAEAAPAAAPKDKVAEPLGVHASRGVMWAISQTMGSKAAGIASQLLLGYLLLDKAFGLAGLAFTFLGFIAITQRFGLTEVLVQRHERFNRWVNAAFWMSLASGLFSSGMVTIAGLVAGWYYGSTDLRWLIIILGLTAPLDALSTCPAAKLQTDLRFRTQNVIYLIGNVTQAALTIALALMHWGAYAIVVPRPIVSLIQGTMFWCAARVSVRPTLDFRRWRWMAGDGGSLTLSNYATTIVQMGDNLALSLFHPVQVVGIYYFAFNLSTQTGQLVATNLVQTFFSVLAKLKHETARQADAFLRAAKAVSLVMIPLCLLQSLVAGPLLRFLWGSKWEPAIPVLQILSVGMAFTSTQGITSALFQAQGRFRFQLRWQILSASLFLLCVFAGAMSGGALAVATSVLVYDIVWYPLSAYVALRPAQIPLRRVLDIYLGPVLFGGLACAAALGISNFTELLTPWIVPLVARCVLPLRLLYLMQCVALSGLALPLYALMMCLLRPRDVSVLTTQVRPLLSRLGVSRRFLQLPGESSEAMDLALPGIMEDETPLLMPVPGRAKVLWMIDGTEIYGARRAVLSLMEGIRAAGWEAEALTVTDGECAQTLRAAGFAVTSLAVARPVGLHLARSGLGKIWQALQLGLQQVVLSRRVREAVRRSDAAAVHIVNKNVLMVGAWAAYREGKPCLWEMTGIVSSGYPGDLNQRLHGWLIRRFQIIPLANSRYTASTLRRVSSQVPVMYLGADTSRFDPRQPVRLGRREMGIPETAHVFTIIARVDESKGQQVFLQSLLTIQRSDLHVLIVGALSRAPEVLEMQAVARKAGATERVHFVELTNDPASYLAMSDVVVNSRLDAEPFGLSVIEGMLMSKPLLVHALGGPAETVVDGRTGWHVQDATVAGFEAAIRRALAEQGRWKEMGFAGRERALRWFSLENQTRWYQHTVLRVLAQRSAGRNGVPAPSRPGSS